MPEPQSVVDAGSALVTVIDPLEQINGWLRVNVVVINADGELDPSAQASLWD